MNNRSEKGKAMTEEQKQQLQKIMLRCMNTMGQSETYEGDAVIGQAYINGLILLELERIANALELMAPRPPATEEEWRTWLSSQEPRD